MHRVVVLPNYFAKAAVWHHNHTKRVLVVTVTENLSVPAVVDVALLLKSAPI